ncbi:hypothetical protein [Lacrimispora sp.]|uniref:hypothetical protein n=1 Tax=Lacrimispora sp. TaxID=2719234 RepID=UPI00289DADA5|nr:hypothetical protein [Lacrimispora sp.]
MKKILTICILCICMILFSGCKNRFVTAYETDSISEQEVESYLDQFLQALNKKDSEAAFALCIHGKSDSLESFDVLFQPILEEWGEEKKYIFKKIGEQERPSKGKRPVTTIYTFQIESESDNYRVSLSIDGTNGINYFTLTKINN